MYLRFLWWQKRSATNTASVQCISKTEYWGYKNLLSIIYTSPSLKKFKSESFEFLNISFNQRNLFIKIQPKKTELSPYWKWPLPFWKTRHFDKIKSFRKLMISCCYFCKEMYFSFGRGSCKSLLCKLGPTNNTPFPRPRLRNWLILSIPRFFFIFCTRNESILKPQVVAIQTPEWKFQANIARNATFEGYQGHIFALSGSNIKNDKKTNHFLQEFHLKLVGLKVTKLII